MSTPDPVRAMRRAGAQEHAPLRSPEVRPLASSGARRGKASRSSPPPSGWLGPMRKERTPGVQLEAFRSAMATGSPAGGMTRRPRPKVLPRKGAFKRSKVEGAPQPVPVGLAVPGRRGSAPGQILSTIALHETKWPRTSLQEGSAQIPHRAQRS